MIEVEVMLRKWGKSIGAVLPKEKAVMENLKEGDRIKLMVMKIGNPLRETFGTLKSKRSTGALLKEVDRDLDRE